MWARAASPLDLNFGLFGEQLVAFPLLATLAQICGARNCREPTCPECAPRVPAGAIVPWYIVLRCIRPSSDRTVRSIRRTVDQQTLRGPQREKYHAANNFVGDLLALSLDSERCNRGRS